MGWRFRKHITIFPGVRLNISKSGISFTFGSKGASVNVAKDGAYLNTSIPGTGLQKDKRCLTPLRQPLCANSGPLRPLGLRHRGASVPDNLTEKKMV